MFKSEPHLLSVELMRERPRGKFGKCCPILDYTAVMIITTVFSFSSCLSFYLLRYPFIQSVFNLAYTCNNQES